jgi:hypothetical protein
MLPGSQAHMEPRLGTEVAELSTDGGQVPGMDTRLHQDRQEDLRG